ncbi:uncharacterized protein C8Q71DRAFT_352167 [Rhodofomes roseus]|uniref:MFS transporter n=1 Tax=Rhodofomes roseus TaxID=34475 RepID=A0ABQ8KT06_9APHY|nr:uncharacterized protein C8Q71DRAFT_352167 [Rhodofomes roseus]KAH9841882.1 hypothetical protein C8Q71DRAFT_352167 [Rhodofomes roseus]
MRFDAPSYSLGVSLSWTPAIALPSQWFKKRLSLVSGIASSDTGVSGVLSLICQALIDRTSIRWNLRRLSFKFLSLVVGLVAVALVRQRHAARKHVEYRILDLSLFRIQGYGLYLALCSVQFFWSVTPVLHTQLLPCDRIIGSGVLSVATAMNAVGHIMAGSWLTGPEPIKVLIAMHLLTALSCIVIWFFAKSIGVMIVFAFFWGLLSGPYWPLGVPACAKIAGMEKLGSAVASWSLSHPSPQFRRPPPRHSTGSRRTRARRNGTSDIVWCTLVTTVASMLLIPVRLHFGRQLWLKVSVRI